MFSENGGFDIIVDTPYVSLQKIKDQNAKNLYKKIYKTYSGNSNLYCLFIEMGKNILSEKGSLGFITSNKWIKTDYGKLLRNYLLDSSEIIKLIDLKSLKVFKKADVDTSLIFLKNGKTKI